MKQKMMIKFSKLICLTLLFSLFAVNVHGATTLTSNATGTHGGYNYEYWKDNGTGSMTLNDGGAFSCSWSNINNILFRKGLKYNETQTHQQLGNMTMNYACNYQPNGNSYLSVYGWTSSPLVEYYIIESWGTWKPPGNVASKGTVTIDGGVYDIFETTRTNQPSIKGTATFQQYWSVRQQKRTSGTISVSEHFKAWEAKGMKMGKFYEISLVVEGYQSSGKADVTSMSIKVGGNYTPPTNTTPPPTPTKPNTPTKPTTPPTILLGDVDKNGTVDSIDFAKYRQYLLGMINSLPDTGDIDKNGSMNSIDFAMLRQHLLGIINLGSSTTPTPTSAPSPKGTIVIMPLGDSITDGLTVAGGYRIKLWEHIKSIGATVNFVGSMSNGPTSLGDKNHEGHSGWTISQIDTNINAWMDTYKPQIVLLHIGTNDIYMSPNGAPERLSTLIDKICAKLPTGGKLYVSNIIPLSMSDVSSYNSKIPGIVQGKAAQGKPVYFVEMYKALTTSDLADGVHPNSTGYNKMADVWFNAIKGDLAN